MVVLTAVAAILVLAWSTRGRVTPVFLTLVLVGLLSVGFAQFAKNGSEVPSQKFYFALLLFVIGYAVTRRLASRVSKPVSSDPPPALANGTEFTGVAGTLVLFVALATYHFAMVGIPILSSAIERARFNFLGSGLGGLPSRIVLFGLTIGFFYSLGGSRTNRSASSLVTNPFLLALIACRLAAGTKGALLDVLIVVFIGSALSRGSPTLLQAVRRYSIPVLVAGLFALGVSGLYRSVAVGGTSGVSYLWQRLTAIGALPGYTVLTEDVAMPSGEKNSLLNDLAYYLPKYTGRTPKHDVFPFVRVVSSRIYRTPLDGETFTVPVTIGAFPTLLADFGIGGFVLVLLLGTCYARLEVAAERTSNATVFMIAGVGVAALHQYVLRGDLVYTVLNWLIMTVFFFLTLQGMKVVEKSLGMAAYSLRQRPRERAFE